MVGRMGARWGRLHPAGRRRSPRRPGRPTGITAATEWFPKRQRALAVGLIHASANISAILTP
jgi:MFS family permease